MSATFDVDPEAPILVEFAPHGGLQPAAIGGPFNEEQLEILAGKSQLALDSAMSTVYNMARKVTATIKDIPIDDRPSQIELEFGLKLDADAGAVIARAGVEASFNVKFVWVRPEKPVPTIPAVGQ